MRNACFSLRLRPALSWLSLAVLYLGLTFLFMWPYVKPWEMGAKLHTVDSVLVAHVLAWGAHALRTDPASYFDLNIFFPLRGALATTDHFFVPAVMSLIPSLFLGPAANFNLQMVLAFWLTAISVHILARDRFGRHALALPVAASFTFCSVRMHHMNGQLHLLAFQWTPLALLFMRRVLLHGGWKNGLAFTVFLFLAFATSWYMALLSAMLLLVFFVPDAWALARTPESLTTKWRRLGAVAAGFALALALLIPLALPYWRLQEQIPEIVVAQTVLARGRPLDHFLPPGFGMHRTAMGILLSRWKPPERPVVYSQFVGWTVLALAAVGAVLAAYDRLFKKRPWPRDLIPWAVLAATAAILTLGPFKWRFGNPPTRLPLFWLYEYAPVTRFFRAPFRFNILEALAGAMLAGMGLERLTRRASLSPRAFRALCALVAAVALAEQFPIWPQTAIFSPQWPPSPIYQTVKRDSAVHALFETPMSDIAGQFNSIAHFKPIANGWSGHAPAKTALDLAAFDHIPNPLAVWRLCDRGITHVATHSAARARPLQQSQYFELVDSAGQDCLFRLSEAARRLELKDLLPSPPPDAPRSIRYALEEAPRWTCNRSMTPFTCNGRWAESRVIAPDPEIFLPCQPFPVSSVDTLEVEAAIEADISKKDQIVFYFALGDEPQMSEDKSCSRLIRTDGQFHTLAFDLREAFAWQTGGVCTGLRLDPGEEFPATVRIARIEFRQSTGG